MDHNAQTTLQGEVTDIFAHRFVVKTGTGKILADLTPNGAEQVVLRRGDQVTVSGEMKPSELKVHEIKLAVGASVIIRHYKPHLDHRESVDPGPVLKTAAANGFAVVGALRRKPKHFEILGRDSAGDFVELHVELGGALRKTRPVERDDPKCAADTRNHLCQRDVARRARSHRRWRDNRTRVRTAAAAFGLFSA
jgi:hypothetical protein